MKPLIVLLALFAIAVLLTRLSLHVWSVSIAGNTAMCAMMLFAAIGHFVYANGMSLMLPAFIPFRKALVWLSGIFEAAAGIGLLFASTRYMDGLVLIAFFILILPLNIYAAYKHVDLEKANYGGKGLSYLWFRVPLQILFIAWVYYFSVMN